MSGASQWSCILWDMDGTIVDASEGILQRLQVTFDHLGKPAPTHDDLIKWIGPPMQESFQHNANLTPEEALRTVEFYRSLHDYDDLGAGVRIYPGVAELINEVAAAGVAQAIASSKPEAQVVPLAEHFGISPDFVAMVGGSDDGVTRVSKADVVREALRRLAEAGVDTSRPVLIGDRRHDIEGGAECGVPVIHVTWGFSYPGEGDGAIATATTTAELRDLILTA